MESLNRELNIFNQLECYVALFILTHFCVFLLRLFEYTVLYTVLLLSLANKNGHLAFPAGGMRNSNAVIACLYQLVREDVLLVLSLTTWGRMVCCSIQVSVC